MRLLVRRIPLAFLFHIFRWCLHILATCGDGAAQVQASFFGVGAPEAVLVGLVALVIFGPQGLAEVLKPELSALSASCGVLSCVMMQHASERSDSLHRNMV